MLEIYLIVAAAVVVVAAIGGLVALGISAHHSAERIAERLSDRTEEASHNNARAVLSLAQAITTQSEELTKSNDRILAVADNRAYQSVKFNENGKKKPRDRHEVVQRV